MTTENIHPENRDVDTSVVESSLVSETGNNLQESITQAASDVTVPAEQETEVSSIPQISENPQGSITQAASDVTIPAEQEIEEQWRPQGAPLHVASPQAETFHEMQEASLQTTETQTPAAQASVEEHLDTQPVQTTQEEIVRPFTDFIEEFRQSESHQSPSEPFSSPLPTQTQTDLTTPWANTPPESTLQALENAEMVGTIEVVENVQLSAPTTEESIQTVEPTAPAEQTAIDTTEQQAVVEQPPASTARPVSPLLRPAAPRGRGSRHGGHRHREEKAASQTKPIEIGSPTIEPAQPETPAAVESTTAAAPVEKTVETSPVEIPTPAESTPVEEPARPPRRYRFDRKTPTTSTGSLASAQAPSARPEENKETLSRVTTPPVPRTNNGHAATIETEPAVGAIPSGHPTEQTAAKHSTIQEPILINESESATVTPSTPIHEHHHAQEHQQIKEQLVPVTSSIPPVELAPEVTAPVAEPVTPPSGEVAPEDLPPLEYSELQSATSRRRRRRRAGNGGGTTSAATTNAASTAKSAAPEAAPPTAAPSPAAAPKNVATPEPNQYNIVSGYTVNQMNQGDDVKGPFMGPEPSPARGSTMHTNVRPIRTESQRPHVYPVRGNEPSISANTMNQLVNAVTQAIQNQTDRMVAELRHANQAPANISVTLPPFPSTERVGVFVDVANLLYSARTLRMTIDFGKLLDFLRGNRRLVRAHAYCPTSPQAGDEQMFLQAVKGLGYRITTKNYKTFSSGAKKADLDLDLCMDVVRLVDGKAVDCIILVSGDSDFMPLLDYCADHGVRVEVAAFDEAMSATLRQSCDLFINLSMLDEIRA